MATKKSSKKTQTTKFDFSDSIKAIKGTAKTMNTQLKDVANEVADDLKVSSEQLVDMIDTTSIKDVYKKAINKVSETVNVETITKATKDVNDYTLKTADELVDGVIANSEKWQQITNKAMKGGLKLAAKQQDIMYDTLETVKDQLSEGATRLRKMFSNN